MTTIRSMTNSPFSSFPSDHRRLRRRRDERHRRRGIPSHVSRARVYRAYLQLWPMLPVRWRFFRERLPVRGATARISPVFKAYRSSAILRRELCRRGGRCGAPAVHTGKNVRRHRAMAAYLRRRWCSFSDRRSLRARTHLLRVRPLPFLIIHFFLGIYTGYFGGALGLITLAVWSLFGLTGSARR